MSANYAVSERIKSGEGKVVDVKETPKGYFVTVNLMNKCYKISVL